MDRWPVVIALDPDDGRPLCVQISRHLVEAILDGRLRGGDRLPSSRALAAELKVHRNTVLAAYDDLLGEGWITARRAQGTFVSDNLAALPRIEPGRRSAIRRSNADAPSHPVGFALPERTSSVAPPTYRRGLLELSRGAPDPRLFPREAFLRSYRRALDRTGAASLTYADPRGHAHLRDVLAQMLASRRGLPGDADGILVTHGSQMGIQLIMGTLLSPGDTIAVEALAAPHTIAGLRTAGFNLLPIPLGDNGIDVAALERSCREQPVRGLIVTPHHQFPTTGVLPPAARLALLEVARTHGLLVVEDDYDHEFHFDGRPVMPLASLDRTGQVVYVGTLSKVLAPGLRIGYLRTAPQVIERLAEARTLMDIQGDHLLEAAIAELFVSGDVGRHLRRMTRINRNRRDALVAALERDLAGVVEVRPPPGGVAAWVDIDPTLDLDAWAAAGPGEGVSFVPGRIFAVDGRTVPGTRLGYSFHDEAELAEAVRRMRRALPVTRRRR